MTAPDPDKLGAQALRRLLAAAVEPIQPGPEAYNRLRDQVARRRNRWVIPVAAVGALALAGIIALSLLLVRQAPSTLSDPLPPPHRVGTPGGGAPGGQGVQGGDSSTTPGGAVTTTTGPSTGPSSTGPAVSPTASVTATNSPGGGDGSQQRPTPFRTPAVAGDIDGDGKPDSVAVSGGAVTFTLSRDGSETVQLPAGSVPGKWALADVDGDGFAELIIQTGTSGGIASYTVIQYLARHELGVLPQPSVARLAAGVTASYAGWGFSCVDKAVEFVSGSSSDGGQTYQVTTTTLRPDLGSWVPVGGTTSSTLTATAAASAFTAQCGTLGS